MPVPEPVFVFDAKGNFCDIAWSLATVWRREKRCIKAIARDLNVEPSTVRYNLRLPMPSKRSKVRPPPVSAAQKREIGQRRKLVEKLVAEERITSRGPRPKYASALAIARAINLDASVPFTTTASTVRRDLKTLDMVSLKTQRGPKRKPGDPLVRMRACRRYLRMARSSLLKIGWTDEKYFDSNDHGGARQWVKSGTQPPYRQRDTWAPRVHVWALIAKGIKFIVRLPSGRQTSEMYKRRCLIPLMKYMKDNGIPSSELIMQYDADCSHGTSNVLDYLRSKGVETLKDFPKRSCDLSCIENLWAIIQKRVDAHGPEDAEELWKFIKAEWDAIPQSEVDNLVGSFESRCRRCVAAKGQTIRTKTPGKSHQYR